MARKPSGNRLCINVVSKSGATSGRVTTKPGSCRLYLDFYRKGCRTEISTGFEDSDENRDEATENLRTILDEIEFGTFSFADAFPGASKKLIAMHEQFDNRILLPHPEALTFSDYVNKGPGNGGGWRQRIMENYDVSKKSDYKRALDYRLLPYFGAMKFIQINGVTVEAFILSQKWWSTKKIGQKLSASRIRNILTVLDTILLSARTEYYWGIADPFDYIRNEEKKKKSIIPKRSTSPSRVFRFAAWECLLSAMPAFYRPIAELFVLTGLIGSEMAGLRKEDIEDGYINICNKRVSNRESGTLKTPYRLRRIPITKALRRVLDILIDRSDSNYVVMMDNGTTYCHNKFKDNIWEPSFAKSGISYIRPYSARHTFAAWAMTLGTDLNKLERLMGHNTKRMLYETYGKYVEGLEEDYGLILKYFGEDFLCKGSKPSSFRTNRPSVNYEESWGETAFVKAPDAAHLASGVEFASNSGVESTNTMADVRA